MTTHNNNFDLIRLGAALSVFASHFAGFSLISATGWAAAIVLMLAQVFPGVPVFFIVSGFLISQSFLANPSLGRYLKARALRILPAFVASTLVTSAILLAFGCFNFTWFINQFTLVGLYGTPQSVVAFSGGMPNPNLWTIPVEVRFYLLLPLLMWPLVKNGLNRHRTALIVGVLMLVSAVLFGFDDFGQHHHPDLRHGITHHFMFFGAGVLARLYWHKLARLVNLPAWACAHVTLCSLLMTPVPYPLLLGNMALTLNTPLTLALVFTLPGLVLSLAYTAPDLARSLLKGNDISYGLYIYHAPYMTALRQLGLSFTWLIIDIILLSFATAIASWKWLERPMLNLK